MKISIFIAALEFLDIVYKNSFPLNISKDRKYLKQITLNHSVVMGRKTFESNGKTRKERRNIIISRDGKIKIEGSNVMSSLE